MVRIDIFNGFMNPYGGSENEALDLYRLLNKHADVKLWATSSRASEALLAAHPINKLSLFGRAKPRGEVYVFVGSHWQRKLWSYFLPRPQRLVYIYNTFHEKHLSHTSTGPLGRNWPAVEYVVISDYQRQVLGVDAVIQPSPINLQTFAPTGPTNKPFCVGRMSRDTLDKHREQDATLYRTLAGAGVRVVLQGATSIQHLLPNVPGLEVYPEGHFSAADFYAEIDVLYYRTGKHIETFGRVIFEAMACGIPVVVDNRGGFIDWIQHGQNGFVVDTEAEALSAIDQLKNNHELREALGRNARQTVEAMYAESEQLKKVEFYCEAG